MTQEDFIAKVKWVIRDMGKDIYGIFFVGGAVICFILFLIGAFLWATWPLGFVFCCFCVSCIFGLRELRKWADK